MDDESLSAREVAALLGLGTRYFSEKYIFKTPDFPAAIRPTDRSPRRWKKSEVLSFIETRREKLAA